MGGPVCRTSGARSLRRAIGMSWEFRGSAKDHSAPDATGHEPTVERLIGVGPPRTISSTHAGRPMPARAVPM
jgi:hypothetical protein